MLIGVRNSSRKISPGCTGGRRRLEWTAEKFTFRPSISSRLIPMALNLSDSRRFQRQSSEASRALDVGFATARRAGEDRRRAFVGKDHEAITYRITVRRSSFVVPLIGTAPAAGSALGSTGSQSARRRITVRGR